MPEAILRLDGVEVRTTDPVCVRTLWGLLATALKAGDVAYLNGLSPPEQERQG
jgi:hypothetical protein